jgi:hypothetical protein
MGSMSENNLERRERLRNLHLGLSMFDVTRKALLELIELIYEDDPHLFEGQTLFETDDEARERLGLGKKAA